MRRSVAVLLCIVFALCAVGGIWWFKSSMQLTQEEAAQTVVTTIERETAQSFLVVGTLDATATVTVRNEKKLLPGSLDLSIGTTTSQVRVPGRIAYGFDVRGIRPEAVRMLEDGTVQVTLPALSVLSAEPDLSQLEVETERGWLRSANSMERVEQRAVGLLVEALRNQGTAHLTGDNAQPRINTAQAMEAMLRPAFAAAGHPDVVLRFQISPTLVQQSE